MTVGGWNCCQYSTVLCRQKGCFCLAGGWSTRKYFNIWSVSVWDFHKNLVVWDTIWQQKCYKTIKWLNRKVFFLSSVESQNFNAKWKQYWQSCSRLKCHKGKWVWLDSDFAFILLNAMSSTSKIILTIYFFVSHYKAHVASGWSDIKDVSTTSLEVVWQQVERSTRE